MSLRFLSANLLLVLAVAAPLRAQSFAEMTGTVSDATGAVVASATVTATSVATNQARRTTTNETGNYSLPYLVPGTYDVRVESPGFKVATRKGVELQVGAVARMDFSLEVGEISQQVEVAGGAPLLSTETVALGARNIRIHESHALNFRFEAFNAVNHPNWNAPSSDARSPATFGIITGARTMRQLQLALKYLF